MYVVLAVVHRGGGRRRQRRLRGRPQARTAAGPRAAPAPLPRPDRGGPGLPAPARRPGRRRGPLHGVPACGDAGAGRGEPDGVPAVSWCSTRSAACSGGRACVLLGYFAAHSISRVTHYLGLTSGVIVVVHLLGTALGLAPPHTAMAERLARRHAGRGPAGAPCSGSAWSACSSTSSTRARGRSPGPFLASLGASALTVGLVTGAGEAAALGLPALLRPRRRPVGPLLALDGGRLRPHRRLRAADGAGAGAGGGRARLRLDDGAARADRQGRAQPGEVGAARGRCRATSAAGAGSACTRRSTRPGRSSARCSSRASSS